MTLTLLMGAALTAAQSAAAGEMPTYTTRYYVIHSDLPVETVREAAVRLNTMAEEYQRRTQGFSGRLRGRMPFYLFGSLEQYYEAGGVEGSVGMYSGRGLMAVADERIGERVWAVVQHEGFHQYAHQVITSRLPVWVDEGMADYFGEGIWTGDGFVTGIIPPARMRRIRAHIENGNLMRFSQMLEMTRRQWREAIGTPLALRNYDQAWSMVHFLVHGDDGRYRDAFSNFINDIADGISPTEAFERRFEGNIRAFEQRYVAWWRSLPDQPTRELEIQATVATMTSFLARATAGGRRFRNVREFFSAAEDGELGIDPSAGPDLWLPDSLLNRAVREARKLSGWSLVASGGRAVGLELRDDDTLITARFRLRRDARPEVRVRVLTAGAASR